MRPTTVVLLAAVAPVYAQNASVHPSSPVTHVPGLAFDRFFQVWLENIDYDDAANDENMRWLASQGITLTNFYAVTHPSEPNYCAVVSGDHFGMNNDDFHEIPSNISTVVDLLDTKNISWAEYQEHMPYPGFKGVEYRCKGCDPDYVRRHNPLILFDSVANNDTRLRQIKNFSHFEDDLANGRLPQWAFVTPNMTNDGHDTGYAFAARWERNWMAPLLNNTTFMNKTLVLLTFDEDLLYFKDNRIFSILLGDAIPDELRGTKDDTFYTHYSTIASISANWGLPSLGRWDCGANIFEIVANKTGYVNYDVDKTFLRLNFAYPGPLSSSLTPWPFPLESNLPWPNPLTKGDCSAGHGILNLVRDTYADSTPTYNYTSPFPVDPRTGYNVRVTAKKKNRPSPSSATPGASMAVSSKPTPSRAGASVALAQLAVRKSFLAAIVMRVLACVI